MALVIRRLGPEEWPAYRAVRLRALRDTPEAFGSTAADAERLTPADWARRLADRTTFVAAAGQELVGLVSGAVHSAGEAELISMWVAPGWRRQGVGRRLVDAVVDWAAAAGFERLRLWVAIGNDAAERLYAERGFNRTGEVQPMGRGAGDRIEFAMTRALKWGDLGAGSS
jgi:GNAT superfamily N-acetyltransferase